MMLADYIGKKAWKNKTHILNSIAALHPKLKGPRKWINDTMGFRQRRIGGRGPRQGKMGKKHGGRGGGGALVGGSGGTIASVNAPVAFAHTDLARPGFYIRHIDEDTIAVHSVDFVATASANAVAGVFSCGAYPINPTDSALFTYLSPLLDLFTKTKLKMLRTHYVHSCPTSTPGSFYMTWCADSETTTPANVGEIVNTNGAVLGAVYEDFRYEVNPKQFEKDWLYISDVTDADEDDRLIEHGVVFLASDGVTTANQVIGKVLFETEWILTGRRAPTLAPMMSLIRQILKAPSSDQAKGEALHALVPSLIAITHRKKARVRKTAEQIIADADLVLGTVELKELAPSMNRGLHSKDVKR